MPIPSAPGFLAAIQQAQLLDAAQLQEIHRSFASPSTDSRVLAKQLIHQGWLTPFQVNHLFQGQAKRLVLGSYLLLERLGEGGMGEVYKARHRSMKRVVALKLIHKNYLSNPNAMQRFHREIQAVAQLNHPNIVHAYDADHIGDTHFLVMEYVPGIDLSKRVKLHGPLPVAAACDYIRQAALGLHHAHERGLIHRDIKPSNLLLTPDPAPNCPWGTITLLDLGLARIAYLNRESGENTLTDSGVVLGTPDFVAPEQARHAKHADARADLYSLGCTFYFLLTGQVPFPADTVGEKLIQHMLEEPAAVHRLRPEVPQGITCVVRQLMAKRPEDRIQTTQELAELLATGLQSGTWTMPGAPTPLQRFFRIGRREGPASFALQKTVVLTPGWRDDAAPRPRKRLRLLLVTAASVFGLGLAAWFLLGLVRTSGVRSGTNVNPVLAAGDFPSASAPDKAVTGSDEHWLTHMRKLPAEEQVKVVARRLQAVNPRFNGRMEHKIDNGVVTEVKVLTDDVTDPAPLRAFTGLKVMDCGGSYEHKSKLGDLSFLQGMALTELVCSSTQVADLTPLRGMKLREVDCGDTPVADLSPLRGMPLRSLNCNGTRVADLTPLQGMPLQALWCNYTPVRDLTPLHGMPLIKLSCKATQVSDLSPLQGMPLKTLVCDFRLDRDAATLRSIKTLEKINDKPAHEMVR